MTKNTDCYARSLNDCDGGISKEHYISKSVLEIGQDDLSSIELGGALAAPPSKTKNLANAYVLCDKHNEELSGLDVETFNFLNSLFNAVHDRKWIDINIQETVMARWLLKFVAGWASHFSREELLPQEFYSKDQMELLFARRAPVGPELTLAVGSVNSCKFAQHIYRIQGGAPAWVLSPVTGNGGLWGVSIAANPIVFTVSLLSKVAPTFGHGCVDQDGICLEGPDGQKLRVGLV